VSHAIEPVHAIEPFRAIAISGLAAALEAEGRSVVHLEFGQPSTGAPAAAIAEAHRRLDCDPGGYWESLALKQRIARHYRDAYQVEVSPDRVILTCGASPALVMALAASFRPGDRVALARPGYVAYRNSLRGLGMRPVEIACSQETRFQLTAAALSALDPAPAGVILASPANPTGAIIPDSELADIAAVCRRRGITIISDEIYHGLSYAGRAASILQFEPSAYVVNSFSKYYSMVGWRLGWLVAPQDRVELARAYMGNFFLTAPSLSQHAGLVAMDCTAELDGHVRTYADNRARLLAALPLLGLRRMAPPDGAFYIYAHVGHLTSDSMALCERLLRETGVAVAPGVDFDPVDGGEYVRFSFAQSSARIQDAIDRMAPWFAVQAERMR
jgi:aspartate/methionine/tyrosine aminotransferase